jgi:hypothetical protein
MDLYIAMRRVSDCIRSSGSPPCILDPNVLAIREQPDRQGLRWPCKRAQVRLAEREREREAVHTQPPNVEVALDQHGPDRNNEARRTVRVLRCGAEGHGPDGGVSCQRSSVSHGAGGY